MLSASTQRVADARLKTLRFMASHSTSTHLKTLHAAMSIEMHRSKQDRLTLNSLQQCLLEDEIRRSDEVAEVLKMELLKRSILPVVDGDGVPEYRFLKKMVIVLGSPGSGKSTICAKIQENLNYVHLSVKDLLRAERQSEGSEFGALIKGHIQNGINVPVDITCSILENAMKANKNVCGYLVDGFDVNQENLSQWIAKLQEKTALQFVLFLSCPVPICIERCLNRGQGRTDDNEESLKKLVETYNHQTFPIIEHFNKSGLVREVKSERPVEDVYAMVESIFRVTNQH